ncbi:hypothetical protein CGZ93_01945 [Enemella dayhoffiae]|uniref:SRPBCC family protein n=1 Tax=Enemella dayhoffiae TaxID=2016507 RepID=A0A255HCX2_9ACTN|nr:hypothetical protein [Enemella dayhoffiae]OYO25236.1 hypothetical protein CGZ93_01945 [Enemella dayhoffiae]
MIRFRVVERTGRFPADALAALLDLDAHTAVIPFTRVRHDGRELREGTEFVARTAVGPVGFDDRMRVEQWLPPVEGRVGRVLISKRGRPLGGRIEILVRPDGRGSVVEWRQELTVLGLPGLLGRPAAAVAAAAYGSVIRRLLACPST